jgi:hypothetical protein
VGSVHVVQAVSGHAADVDTHADLPKHAFGSCPVCARQLLSQQPSRPVERRRRSRADLPTRFLVQTSAVLGSGGEQA